MVTQATGALGLPKTLEAAVNQVLLGAVKSGNETVISKTKDPVNFTQTTAKIPLHATAYLTFKGGLFYALFFRTYDKQQTDFLPLVKAMVGSFRYSQESCLVVLVQDERIVPNEPN